MNARKIIDLPGQPHFATFSTYQRRRFLDPERTRMIVMETLQEVLGHHQALCHGFVVMPNHVHALLTVNETAKLSTFLLAWKKTGSYRIKRFYAQELTKYQELCPEDCPIWQAKYYDSNVETDREVNARIDYMHHNPVTAGFVPYASDWVWSSARFYERNEDVGVAITPLV